MNEYINIIKCLQQFDFPDEEYTEHHEFNILQGKVLLFLLTTLGEPSFFSWLSSATPKGSYYEFREFKIMRRAERIRDTIQINNYDEFKKAVRQFAGKDIENPDLLTILDAYLINNKGKSLSQAQAFLDASVLLSTKLARYFARKRYLPGDILTNENGIIEVDLIDLYCQQQNLQDREEAVALLAEKFNISSNPFEPLNFDKRTRWTQTSYHGEVSIRDNCIDFYDDAALCGRVWLEDHKINAVETFWAKDLSHTPYKKMDIPWSSDAPLWNLNRIREIKNDGTVILTDSLVCAYEASKASEMEIHRRKDALNELRHPMRYKDNVAGALENELFEAIKPTLQEQFPLFEQNERNSFIGTNGLMTIGRKTLFVEEFYRALYCITTLESHEYECDGHHLIAFEKYLNIACQQLDLKQQHAIRRKNFTSYIAKTYPRQDWSEDSYKVFFRCLVFLKEEISKRKQLDRERSTKLEEELKELKTVTLSSWYGGGNTLPQTDFRPLRRKNVIYWLKDGSRESFRTAMELHQRFVQLFDSASMPRIEFIIGESNEKISFFRLKTLAKLNWNIDEIEALPPLSMKQFADRIDFTTDSLLEEEETFIFEPLIRKGSINMIYSEPNVGKTFFVQSMALAMVYGVNLFNISSSPWKAKRPLRVLYIDSEMSKGSFFKRLRMMHPFYQEKSHEKPVLEYKLVAKSDWDLAGENAEYRDLVSQMLHLGTKEQIDFVIFDNLSTLTGGSDSQKSWMTFFAWLRKLSSHGVASCCLHHASKSGDQRGTSLRSATLDNVIRLKKALSGQKRNLAMTLTVEKARDVSGENLPPLQIELKRFAEDDWRWVTTLAKGKKSLSVDERNSMFMSAYNSKAFSIKVLADYFGIEESTAKMLLKKQRSEKP